MSGEPPNPPETPSPSPPPPPPPQQPIILSPRKHWEKWQNTVPSYIRFFCFFWQFIKYSYQFIICQRQLGVLNERRRIPRVLYGKLPPQTFERARKYQKELIYLEMISCGYYIVYEWWCIYYAGQTKLWFLAGPILDFFGFWPDGWDQETGETIIFIAEVILLGHLIDLPINVWKIFVIEDKYGFNRMSIFTYCSEWVKVVCVETLWSVSAGVVILVIVKETGRLFFLWVWLFCFIWLMITLAVYPNVVAPMFNEYSKLRDGRLRDRLHRLAHYIGFPLGDILVLHQNWKSAHRDAYFFGFMASKRIVLFDTLLAGYPEADTEHEALLRSRRARPHGHGSEEITEEDESLTSVPSRILGLGELSSTSRLSTRASRPVGLVSRASMYDIGFTEYEIEALVARLMGHWVLSHSIHEVIFPLVSLFLFFFIFSYCYQASSLFTAFELPKGMDKPIMLGLRLLYSDVMDVYRILVGAVMRWLARNREIEADSFATRLNYGDDLIDALIELNKENLGFPYFDGLYWSWHYSEPSLLQRIEGIEEEMRRMEWRR